MDSSETPPKMYHDAVVLLALDMDLPTILNYCLSNKKFNNDVCESQIFWRNKYQKDFPGSKLIPANNKINTKNYYKYIQDSLNKNILPPDAFRSKNDNYEILYNFAINGSLETICNKPEYYNLCKNENTWKNMLNYFFGYIHGNPESYKMKYFPKLTWRQFFIQVTKTPSILKTGF